MSAEYDNRYARDILGLQESLRLSRLGEWHALDVRCTACGNRGYITVQTLRRYYPRHVRIIDMEHRFRCTRCNERGAVTWYTVKQRR